MNTRRVLLLLVVLCVGPLCVALNNSKGTPTVVLSLIFFILYMVGIGVGMVGMVRVVGRLEREVSTMGDQHWVMCQWRAAQTIIYVVLLFIFLHITSILYIAFGLWDSTRLGVCVSSHLNILIHSFILPILCFFRIAVLRKHVIKMFRMEGVIRREMLGEREKGTLRIITEPSTTPRTVAPLKGFHVMQRRY